MADNRALGSVLNNDINNILWACSGAEITPEEYQRGVFGLLDAGPGVLAQNVGMPDPVLYRSRVATTWDTYHTEVLQKVWPDLSPEEARKESDAVQALMAADTDPLSLTIACCRERGVPIVASYRMNAEDFYHGELDAFDFGRAHRDWAIPGAHCLDPAIPEVFEHRMEIFREVIYAYEIDGIEFDFRRWTHMISDPLDNHPVLTRMVAETRALLDEAAREKRLLLGVRVGAQLIESRPDLLPGAGAVEIDRSCRDLGLDVRRWIEEEYVDYVCPSLFWPRWPGLPDTRAFVDLTRDTRVGIYPSLFPIPAWIEEGPIEVDDTERLLRYKNEFCDHALKCYEDGADGISTYNWTPHHQPGMVRRPMREEWGLGAKKVQMYLHRLLGDPEALRQYRLQDARW